VKTPPQQQLTISQSINQSIKQSINQSVNKSTNQQLTIKSISLKNEQLMQTLPPARRDVESAQRHSLFLSKLQQHLFETESAIEILSEQRVVDPLKQQLKDATVKNKQTRKRINQIIVITSQ
jgi:hypothetical protein